VLRFEVTVDLSTGDEVGFDLQVSGPHPLFDQDICKVVAPFLGTEAAAYLTARPLGSTGAGIGYYEYLPPSYSSSGAKSPLLVVTNGYGENGDGSAEQLSNLLFTGIPRFIYVGGWPTERPLVVLSTQHVEDPPGFDFSPCDDVTEWGGSCAMQLQHDRDHASPAFCTTPDEIHAFITYAVAHYNVDPSRVYLTGLSCGGFGVWEYLAAHGDSEVGAAVPVAAEGRPAWATAGCGLADVPLRAFHGELDDVVNRSGASKP
jgi:predicted peptidase